MKKISKHLISLVIVSLLVLPIFVSTTSAQFDPGLNQVQNGLNNSLTSTDPRTVIGRVINLALGFLGVIAVGIILLGGFKWMTAGGNEEKTGEAKKLLGAGVIGLIIILASWAIATYVINSLNTAMT
jgi:hypothetical protein